MKWVTLICLFVCTIVTESRYFNKRDAEHNTRVIGAISITIGQGSLDNIILSMLAQNFQKCTLEQLLKTVDEFRTIALHCVDHEDEAECQKPLIALFHDTVCKHEHIDKEYPWTTKCCVMQEPEREKCFHENRDTEVEAYKKPEVDFVCKDLKENPKHAYHYYVYNVARRHIHLLPLSVLTFAGQYHTIVIECCAEENQVTCFETKFTEILKNINYMEGLQKHSCHIIANFPEDFLNIKLARLAQRYGAMCYEEAHKLAVESVHSAKDCCQGNVVECMVERLELNQHICANQEKISSNLKVCCEKPILERTPCMYSLPKEPFPEDLPKDINEFISGEACKQFADKKDDFLAKFLFEFARRHQDLSHITMLRVEAGYKRVLTKCCAESNPVECLKSAPQLLEAGIKEAQDLAKQKCEAFEKLGPYGYQMHALYKYAKIMPQASEETLLEITDKMTKIGGKCCALPESQRYACAEEKLDMLLGKMCEKQAHTFVNDQVRHCCTESYSNRRPCFTALGIDPSYKPPQFDENALQVHADICKGTEDEKKNKRLTLLIHLLKLKPGLSEEETMKCAGEFTKVREKCCAQEDNEVCFARERIPFLAKLKALLEHKILI
ncbi:albumin-like [Bufo bufo]|uniref:albumin-like n=1 Tax=Bufo bufo TaxID=8384 RepID=UPI001ABEE79E|nr:albumin-like [Bufo bufo]